MTNSELLNTQTSVENADNVESTSQNIAKYVTVDDTPFAVVEDGGKWIIVFGQYKASTREFNNVDDAKEYINSKPWELILTACYAYNDMVNELRAQEVNDIKTI